MRWLPSTVSSLGKEWDNITKHYFDNYSFTCSYLECYFPKWIQWLWLRQIHLAFKSLKKKKIHCKHPCTPNGETHNSGHFPENPFLSFSWVLMLSSPPYLSSGLWPYGKIENENIGESLLQIFDQRKQFILPFSSGKIFVWETTNYYYINWLLIQVLMSQIFKLLQMLYFYSGIKYILLYFEISLAFNYLID